MKEHYKSLGYFSLYPSGQNVLWSMVCTIKGRSREANYCRFWPNHTHYAKAFMRANDVIYNSIST